MTIIWKGTTEYRFYWAREIAFFVSREEARKKVEWSWQYRWVREVVRNLLWRKFEEDTKDEEIIDYTAELLRMGDLVTQADGPINPRWRLPLPNEDRECGNQFMRGFQRDHFALEDFRDMYRLTFSISEAVRLRDDMVLRGLASLMTAGELVVGFRTPPAGSHKHGPTAHPASSPSASGALVSAPREEPPDPPMNLAASQAAALQAAAQSGTPFCDI